MRIQEVRAIPVRVPRKSRFMPKTAHGVITSSEYVLLEMETDEGITGVGEVTCSPSWNGEDAAGTTALLRNQLSESLRGANPMSWSEVSEIVDSAVRSRPFLRAGIEMACMDAMGRALGLSVAQLLGGARRHEIMTKFVLPARDVDIVRAMAKDLSQYPVSTVKVKVGTGLEGDIERVGGARDVLGPEVILTVDANEGWQPEEARRALQAFADAGVTVIEQPLSRWVWHRTAELRTPTGPAIMADESVWTLADVLRAHETRAFDVVSVYPGKCGGMRNTLLLAQVAETLGLGVSFGSNMELGIGAAALAHTIAATPILSEAVPSDLIGPLYFESDLVKDSSFVDYASSRLPSGPGLGVELDRDAAERYRTDR